MRESELRTLAWDIAKILGRENTTVNAIEKIENLVSMNMKPEKAARAIARDVLYIREPSEMKINKISDIIDHFQAKDKRKRRIDHLYCKRCGNSKPKSEFTEKVTTELKAAYYTECDPCRDKMWLKRCELRKKQANVKTNPPR